MRSIPRRFAAHVLQAVEWAVEAAVDAAAQGTFGVGGVLLGPELELLALSRNHVVANGVVADPTAHGERQLIDWYFGHLHAGERLPPPQRCLIVSSLDPCMMCAGSILRSGFPVVSTTMDEGAGLNHSCDASFAALPAAMRGRARDLFGYLAVVGRRSYQGRVAGPGSELLLSASLEDRSRHGFSASLERVQHLVHGSSEKVADLQACEDLDLEQKLKEHCPSALTLRFLPGQPDQKLAEPLLAAARDARSRGGAYNSAALLDHYGNLVYLATGREELSPIRTAFMELTRGWSRLHAEAGFAGKKYLAHLKDCTLVTLQGPGPDPASIMELGAYGSSVEGPLAPSSSARWQYVLARQSQSQLEATVAALPPLYSEIIRPRIEQVEDRQLREWCSQ